MTTIPPSTSFLVLTIIVTSCPHVVHPQFPGQSSRGINNLGLQSPEDFNNQGFQATGIQDRRFDSQNPNRQSNDFQGAGSQGRDSLDPRRGSSGILPPGFQGPRVDSPKVGSPGVCPDSSFRVVEELGGRPGNLTCFSCKLDFRKSPYEWSHPCLGRHNGLNVSRDYLVRCGPNDLYCRAERTEVNGVLISLTRECTDICYFGCRPKGFGISSESCAKCCSSNACNDMYPPSSAPTITTATTPSVTTAIILECKKILG
ncbi:uncharacterized protein LOC121858626 [Homarus americanus]|uniref:uncharacterized protein LOC121858626 n=1 Tax=Homarus americanus TaxID=6706 RepID=UPI001C43B100|nr:uncharacterized protein LOC121858626 [Homarus americanus]